jgi:hypothetical protein
MSPSLSWFTALAVIVLWCTPVTCLRAAEADPDQVKAAYLLRFADYVEWPAASDTDANPPFLICVLGAHPVLRILAQATDLPAIKGRTVVARQVDVVEDASPCDILFIPPAQAGRIGEVHAQLRSQPVLVVGDSPGLARRGAVINFVMQNERLRFEISIGTARAAGLKISAGLLKLATIVE